MRAALMVIGVIELLGGVGGGAWLITEGINNPNTYDPVLAFGLVALGLFNGLVALALAELLDRTKAA